MRSARGCPEVPLRPAQSNDKTRRKPAQLHDARKTHARRTQDAPEYRFSCRTQASTPHSQADVPISLTHETVTPLGLLPNFHEPWLRHGIMRIINDRVPYRLAR